MRECARAHRAHRRGMIGRAVLAAVVVLPWMSLGAQGPSGKEKAVDGLEARVRIAKAALQAFDDSFSRIESRRDTVDLGELLLVAAPGHATEIGAAARAALKNIRARFGNATSRLRDHHTVFVRGDSVERVVETDGMAHVPWVSGPTSRQEWSYVYVVSLLREGKAHGVATIDRDTALLRKTLEGLYFTALAGEARTLFRWSRVGLAAEPDPESWWALRRIEFASSEIPIAKRCYGGDLESCAIALGLRPTIDPFVEWGDAEWRRKEVERRLERDGIHRTMPLRETVRCRQGIDDGCLQALRYRGQPPEPLPSNLRKALVEEAVRLGGPGALERSLDSASSPGAVIAAIAGVPLDSVIASWRNHILTARRPSERVTPRIGAISLLWMAVFAVLGMRSSRWR